MSESYRETFQTPNAYIDKFMHLLTPEENTVLFYAVRRIFGFRKEQDFISLSQFERGTPSDTGEMLDNGTGLNRDAIRHAIGKLKEFGILIEVAAYNPMTNTPTCYRLQRDPERVNLPAMEERLTEQKRAAEKRTEKARKIKKQNKTPVCPTDEVKATPNPVCPTDHPRLSDKQPPVCPTVQPSSVRQPPIETKLETQLETKILCADGAPAPLEKIPISSPIFVAVLDVLGINWKSGLTTKELKINCAKLVRQLASDGITPEQVRYVGFEMRQMYRWKNKQPITVKDFRDNFNAILTAPESANGVQPNGTHRNYNQPQPSESAAQRRERKLRGLLDDIGAGEPPPVQHADGFNARVLFLN